MSGKLAVFSRGVTAGIVLAVGLIAGQSPARATLTTAFQFNGAGNWSIDGCGSFQTDPVCDIQAIVPPGSTVEAAFLYSSLFATPAIPAPPVVVFGGTTYEAADWTDLGRTTGASLQAFRADVTEQVAATRDRSFIDNIVFAGLNLTARAGVNAPPPLPPPSVISEPESAIIFRIGRIILGAAARRIGR